MTSQSEREGVKTGRKLLRDTLPDVNGVNGTTTYPTQQLPINAKQTPFPEKTLTTTLKPAKNGLVAYLAELVKKK